METSHRIHEHKTISQRERFKKALERTLEDQRLEKLKTALRAKMEPTLVARSYKTA
jgi:hypothetical protein